MDRAAPREQPTTQKSKFVQVQINQMDEEEMEGKGENEESIQNGRKQNTEWGGNDVN